MERVAKDTYRLGTRGHNFYLLIEDGEAALIDAGCSGEWPHLTAALASLGLALDAVRGVVVTHSHADHFGLAKQAIDEGIDVSVHEAEETRALGTYTGRYSASASDLPFFNIHALRNFLPMIRRGIMKLSHVETVGTFRDGDVLDVPGRPTAVHTPGHTEGHVMFHSPTRGLLFTGDGLVTMNLLGPERGPQLIEPRFNLDHDQARDSLERLEGLDADLLLPGHGDPWKGSPAEAVATARS